jgi:hypothetical protein
MRQRIKDYTYVSGVAGDFAIELAFLEEGLRAVDLFLVTVAHDGGVCG